MRMLDDTRVETRKLYTRLAPRGLHLASGGSWFVRAGVCVCGVALVAWVLSCSPL